MKLFELLCVSQAETQHPVVHCWEVNGLFLLLLPEIERLQPCPVLGDRRSGAAFVAVDPAAGGGAGAAACGCCDAPHLTGLVSTAGGLGQLATEIADPRCRHVQAVVSVDGSQVDLRRHLKCLAVPLGDNEGVVLRLSLWNANVHATVKRRLGECVAVRATPSSRRCMLCSAGEQCDHVAQIEETTGSRNASAYRNAFEQLDADMRPYVEFGTRALTKVAPLRGGAASSMVPTISSADLQPASFRAPTGDPAGDQELDLRCSHSSLSSCCGQTLGASKSRAIVVTRSAFYWVLLVCSRCNECWRLETVWSRDLLVYSEKLACEVSVLQEAIQPHLFLNLSALALFEHFLTRTCVWSEASIKAISNSLRGEFANAIVEYLRQLDLPYNDVIQCRCPASSRNQGVLVGDGLTLGHSLWRAAVDKPHDPRFASHENAVFVPKRETASLALVRNRGVRGNLCVLSKQNDSKKPPSQAKLWHSLVSIHQASYTASAASGLDTVVEYIYSVLARNVRRFMEENLLEVFSTCEDDLQSPELPLLSLPDASLPLLQHLSTLTPVQHWLPLQVRPLLRFVAQSGWTRARSRSNAFSDLANVVPSISSFIVEQCNPTANGEPSRAQQLLGDLLEVSLHSIAMDVLQRAVPSALVRLCSFTGCR